MLTLYHNKQCSKSRACLQLIQAAGMDVEVVDYIEHPINMETLHSLAKQLGLKTMLRTQESIYQELGLDKADDEKILSALCKYPKLLQRPIVVKAGQAMIARPPEKVLEFLHG